MGISSPRESQSQIDDTSLIPRSEEKYTRIENYDDINFTNSLMFEFSLRNERFLEIYNAYCELFKPNVANHILLIELLKIEKNKNSFSEFGYDTQQMLTYIYWMQNKPVIQAYNQYENIDVLIKSFSTYKHKLYKDIFKNQYEYISQHNPDFINVETLKILKYNFAHPEYHPTKYNEFNLIIEFNALENKDVVQNRMKNLIDEFYERFQKLDAIYLHNGEHSNVALTIDTELESTKKIAGKNNQKVLFANHFYIYDQKKAGVSSHPILSALDEYLNSDTSFNIKTLRKYNDRMKKWLQDQSYQKFYYRFNPLKDFSLDN